MKITLVNDMNPFKQDMLSQSECYILDTGVNVFVWKGIIYISASFIYQYSNGENMSPIMADYLTKVYVKG